jgi:hypothetical protein
MICLLLCAAALAAQAPVADQVRVASISGSQGTSGKCTIEVRVDMAAEVDIYGNSGRLRTLAGQPATWIRFVCTDALPFNMKDFRLKGIDGRGSVKLLQDPRSNNSMAVIRIDDPRPGTEGYTFDIEWSGASGGAPAGGLSAATLPASSWGSGNTAERAMDLCRAEVHARAERDYGLRDIDITALAVDINLGRNDSITGTFSDTGGNFRRTSGYRFNCMVDFNSNQVRTLDLQRADGSRLQPFSSSMSYGQEQAFRACQDAVVARTNRDGYQNTSFISTALDPRRSGWVTGAVTASRGPVTDTLDFGCSMDLSSARVLSLQINRR